MSTETAAAKFHGPVAWLFHVFAQQPLLALFLTIAAGYALGRIKYKGIGLGTTAATLIIGLAVSLVESSVFGTPLDIDPIVQTLFFNFFMFAVGLRVGPQFFAGLERDGWRFVGVTAVVALLAPILAILAGLVFELPKGAATGVLAGGMTASAALGAAQSAIPTSTEAKAVADNLSAAFTLTYILSMTSFVLLVKYLPRLFHRDPVAAAHQMEVALQGENTAPVPGSDSAFVAGYTPLAHRAFRVENPAMAGLSLPQVRALAPRASIELVRRDGAMVPVDADFRLQLGDEIGVIGNVEGMIRATGQAVGPELADPVLRDLKMETDDLVVTNRAFAGKTLRQLGDELGGGVYLVAWFRGGNQLPITPEGEVKRGDVLRVTGGVARLENAGKHLGGMVRYNVATDILTLALGLGLGLALGLLAVKIGTVKFALGSAVGLLLAGVALGTLRARNPLLGGPVPDPARALLEDLGLAVFIATLALTSGPGVVQSIRGGTLVPVLLAGLAVALIPALTGYAVGLSALKLNPSVLLGAICGARCNTAGLKVAQEEAHSAVPAIGFAVPTALGTVLLTIAAYLMIIV
jgi:putative transport protein